MIYSSVATASVADHAYSLQPRGRLRAAGTGACSGDVNADLVLVWIQNGRLLDLHCGRLFLSRGKPRGVFGRICALACWISPFAQPQPSQHPPPAAHRRPQQRQSQSAHTLRLCQHGGTCSAPPTRVQPLIQRDLRAFSTSIGSSMSPSWTRWSWRSTRVRAKRCVRGIIAR